MECIDAKILTVKVPTGKKGSTDRLFHRLRDRYLESGSEEDLKDIERLACDDMHAAYWLSEKLAEDRDDAMAATWMEKASGLGCGRASAELILALPDEFFENPEDVDRIWNRIYRPKMRSMADVFRNDGYPEQNPELRRIVTEAAETDWRMNLLLMWDALRRDRSEEFRERAERGCKENHAVAMWTLASDLVLDARSCVDASATKRTMERAIDLFEASRDRLWYSSRDLGVQLFCARGVARDIPRAAECFLDAAERGSEEALRWLDFLTSGPSVDELSGPEIRWRCAGEDVPVPEYFAESPEWLVLREITGSELRSDYPQLCNEWGGFENDVFSIIPRCTESMRVCGMIEIDPHLVFKPTGFNISWGQSPEYAYMSQDIGWDRLSRILRVCIDSACDSIRGLDA